VTHGQFSLHAERVDSWLSPQHLVRLVPRVLDLDGKNLLLQLVFVQPDLEGRIAMPRAIETESASSPSTVWANKRRETLR
jgi:hypothetical protein